MQDLASVLWNITWQSFKDRPVVVLLKHMIQYFSINCYKSELIGQFYNVNKFSIIEIFYTNVQETSTNKYR